ncbi:uncharacterized protein LOC122497804 [Leptopilina heterotoma]|uniref:uncharacterized protein LOC122497804 n=1 Tax=Leptopilina heterotoma TaxID=63436 RepID=UPI001CA8B34B|nr:uncharacterized protein LOC122497804 [Leptopilina heterotoma]
MAEANLQVIYTNRSVRLSISGFLYCKHSSNSKLGRIYWNCKQKGECHARATTSSDLENLSLFKGPKESPHEHAPNRDAVDAERIVARVKRVAEEHPELLPAQIIRRELQNVPSGILSEMPERPNLRKQISRTRLRHMPSNPIRISDLEEIPEHYRQTLGGNNFLLYDSYHDDEEEEDVTQVGVNRKPQTVGLPFVHALLENKRQSSYLKVLNIVLKEGRKLIRQNLKLPIYIMTDFEVGIINAAKEVLGDDEDDRVNCCFFHLSQNVFRRIQAEGLQELYEEEDEELVCGSNTAHQLIHLDYGTSIILFWKERLEQIIYQRGGTIASN